MAAKKKSPPQSSNAAEKRASSKKSASKKSGPQWGTGKPTAAFTNVGQKSTGLAKRPESQRQGGIMSTNKRQTKVKSATGFAGSGGPFRSMPMMGGMSTKKALIGGALIVTTGPGKGKIFSAIARKAGVTAGDAAYVAAAKGLETATGAGGRVAKTFTPFGPTLRSTVIGTSKQQSARMGNLLANAERIAAQTEAGTAKVVRNRLVAAGAKAKTASAAAGTAYATRRKRTNKK